MMGVALDRYLPGRNAMLANESMYGYYKAQNSTVSLQILSF
jgi:hypothetical protein